MNMLNTVDKTSTTDRLDVKMSKKAEICKGTHWQQDNIEGYDLTWLNEKVVPDSRCYCWETNGLTVEVVEWGPRIYEIDTNYKTLKVIEHCSDFEIKTLRHSSITYHIGINCFQNYWHWNVRQGVLDQAIELFVSNKGI